MDISWEKGLVKALEQLIQETEAAYLPYRVKKLKKGISKEDDTGENPMSEMP